MRELENIGFRIDKDMKEKIINILYKYDKNMSMSILMRKLLHLFLSDPVETLKRINNIDLKKLK